MRCRQDSCGRVICIPPGARRDRCRIAPSCVSTMIHRSAIWSHAALDPGRLHGDRWPLTVRRGVQSRVAEQPQLIMLDVMLPDMRGWDVLRALKARSAYREHPGDLPSALDATEDRVRGLELGADDYIGKPFATQELLARVRTQLRHAEEHLLSELTELPGNTQIQRTLRRELEDPQPRSLCALRRHRQLQVVQRRRTVSCAAMS